MSLKSYCEENNRLYILQEWDTEKNLPLTPDDVAHTSATPVWWKCKKGHSWCTQVRSRSKKLYWLSKMPGRETGREKTAAHRRSEKTLQGVST